MRQAQLRMFYQGGWRHHGDTLPNAREALVSLYGTYEPDATTTGVPDESKLTEWNSPSTEAYTWPAGLHLEDKIVYGDVTPPAAGEGRADRCKFVGGLTKPTSDTGVIKAMGALRGGMFFAYDCTIDPRVPANGRNGFQGRQYHAERCLVRNVTDAFGVFSTLGPGTAADDDIIACSSDQLIYTYPDPATSNHTDGAHTDGLQIQGGLNVRAMYNSFRGYSVPEAGTGTNPEKPWLLQHVPGWANGAAVLIQNNTGAGIDGSVVVDKNWTRGGVTHYNLKATGAGAQVSNGRVYRDVAVGTGLSGYWVRLETGLTQTSYAGLDSHVWVDGPYAGQALTFASRDRGEIIG